MTKILKNIFFLQNINIYTPIDRSRQAELIYIIFDLIWNFFHIKKIKNHRKKYNLTFDDKNKSN